MADFNIRSDSVDVEQIMKQIRARIMEKRGVDYTEDQIREIAAVRLEKFLDPKSLRSDLLEQFRRSRPAIPAEPPPVEAPYEFADETLVSTHRGGAALHPQAAAADPQAVLQPEHAESGPAHAGTVQRGPAEARAAPQDRVRSVARRLERALLRSAAQPRARDDAQRHRAEEPQDARRSARQPARFQRAARPRARRRRPVPPGDRPAAAVGPAREDQGVRRGPAARTAARRRGRWLKLPPIRLTHRRQTWRSGVRWRQRRKLANRPAAGGAAGAVDAAAQA